MTGKRNLTCIAEQLVDGIDRATDDPLDRPHAHTFAEQGEDLGALGEGQLVHAPIVALCANLFKHEFHVSRFCYGRRLHF